MADQPKMLVFEDFPELLALETEELGDLGVQWMQTPVAKECGVKSISIGGGIGGRTLGYMIDVDHDPNIPDHEQQYPFPLENYLDFLIGRVATSSGHREEMRSRIPRLRERSPEEYRRFTMAVPRRLYTRCKATCCRCLIQTNLTLRPWVTVDWRQYDRVTCPRCGETYNLDPRELFTQDDREGEGRFKGIESMIQRDPTLKPFSIRINWPSGFAEGLKLIQPISGRLNDKVFEDRAPETVMCMGPHKSERGDFAHLVFVERPVSFNKVFDESTERWEVVLHTQTGKSLYELADFSYVLDLRAD